MSRSSFIFLACAWLLFIGTSCSNEPYDIMPLGIVQVQTPGTTGATNAYIYSDHRISNFIRRTSTATDTMYFTYLREGLARIVNDSSIADSTDASYKVRFVTGSSSKPQVDSLFHVTSDSLTLLEARRFSYDANQQLSTVEVTTWATEEVTTSKYELVWEGGNVTSQREEVLDPAGEMTVTLLTIAYDNSIGIYSTDVAYLYTLPIDQLYWLSANNPVNFLINNEEEVIYSYTYNKFGYPAQIKSDRGLQLAHTYKEMR
jgi:hypothetical protein